MALHVLSAGAANGLVLALEREFTSAESVAMEHSFGAVGVIRERLDAGAPCDVLILTLPMLNALADAGRVQRESIEPLGRVRTGIAVRKGQPWPAIGTREALAASFAASDELYLPDPERATAGIHCVNVLKALDLLSSMAARLRPYANGAAAMAALAASATTRPIGCTQVTEIRYTPGVELVGVLPHQFELATIYAVAITAATRMPQIAQRFASLLASDSTRALRVAGGFEEMAQ
jgi:molybdate transport system substrate-binding protein